MKYKSLMMAMLVLAVTLSLHGQDTHPRTSNSAMGTAGLVTPSKNGELVAFHSGTLVVKVKNRSIGFVLEMISQRSHVAIISEDDMAEKISVSLEKLPVDEALHRILQNHYDAFYFYGSDKDGTALRAVWVYAAGHGTGVEPVPPEKWASTKEFEHGLSSKDAKIRGEAIEAIIERKGQGALDAVLGALSDTDDYVRTQALYYAQQNNLELPPDRLSDLALTDVSPDVRFLALQALEGTPSASDVAQRALNDPNSSVQTLAKEILASVKADTSARPYQKPPPP
jgi:hypothetical protein